MKYKYKFLFHTRTFISPEIESLNNVPLGSNDRGDRLDALVHRLQTQLLVQSHAGHHVHRGSDQLDLHGAISVALLLALTCWLLQIKLKK